MEQVHVARRPEQLRKTRRFDVDCRMLRMIRWETAGIESERSF